MIYCFDDFQLKHLCDVIEAERRVRERLYNELKWTNAWSPAGVTRRQRPSSGRNQKSLKQRPSSARKYEDVYDTDTSYDERPRHKDRPSSAREQREKVNARRKPKTQALETTNETPIRVNIRPHSAHEPLQKVKEYAVRKPRTIAFQIGSESKSVAVKWGTDPRQLSVTMGDGYGRKPPQSKKKDPGHDKFTISNFGKGSSFQVDPGRTSKDPTNITIDNVRRGGSGPKETLRVTGGGTNVVIHNPKQSRTPGGSETIHVASGDSDIVIHKPTNVDSDSSQRDSPKREKRKSKTHTKKKDSPKKDIFENYGAIQFSQDTGTQTAWMDTDPDPPPDSSPAFRRIKFMGEDKIHKEYKTAFVDDQNLVRPMTDEDIPLVVEVTQPDVDDDDEEDVDEESRAEPDYRPEVIHYIDKTIPARAIEPFEPVFVQPHPIWEVSQM